MAGSISDESRENRLAGPAANDIHLEFEFDVPKKLPLFVGNRGIVIFGEEFILVLPLLFDLL